VKIAMRLVPALVLSLLALTQAQPAGELFVYGLSGPMGLLVDSEGNLWIVDSGMGGDRQLDVVNPETGEPITAPFGMSSRVIRVAPDGSQEVVATLPSLSMGMEVSGGSRLAILDGRVYATSGIWMAPFGGDPEPLMGTVVRIEPDGQVTEVASTYAFELAHNPDPNIVDSHPYGIAAGPDGMLYVADAGGNSVLRVDPNSGEVSLVAVLDGIPGPLPNPNRGGAMEADSVPTGVTVDAQGNAFVGLLPGFPFVPGSSKVVMISPSGEVSDFATDLTLTTDVQRGPDGSLYAVQIGVFTEEGPVPDSGRVVRLSDDGSAIEVLSGLSFPTAIAFTADGDAFVTVNGAGGPGGAVMRYAGLAAE